VVPQLQLIAHRKELQDNPEICIPDELLDKFIQFYHLALSHVGMIKQVQTVISHFWHSDLRRQTERYICTCENCQKSKQPGRGYGHLAVRHQAQLSPWHEVAIDLIGPWEMEMSGYTLVFRALTIIETVTNFVKLSKL